MLIVANWKLNGNRKKIKEFFKEFLPKLDLERDIFKNIEIAISPPIVYLYQVKRLIRNSFLKLCSQDLDVNLKGSYTGATSALMLKDLGVKYVIIGHSERRNFYSESDDLIAKKFFIARSVGLIPIYCIGENEEENRLGKTEFVCLRQINTILKTFGKEAFINGKCIVAYEPTWAIGSKRPADPKKVQFIHKLVRDHIFEKSEFNSTIKNLIIQYGGSVNSDNALEYLCQDDVNGLLVGSASLGFNSFFEILKSSVLLSN